MHGAAILALALVVQEAKPDSAFLSRSDVQLSVAGAAATTLLAVYDRRIARWTRQPSVQGDSARHDLVSKVTVVNEMPLTVAAVATFGVGRLARQRTVADVGLHLTAALLATEVLAEVMRVGLGRERPRSSPDDPFRFLPGRGLRRFENRAFPSLHAAVAFTTAAALVEEIRQRRPSATRYAAPALYAVAMVPGLTRLYLDQHWASDVLAGSILGAVVGRSVVRHAHRHPTRLDKVLLGAVLVPSSSGASVGWSITR